MIPLYLLVHRGRFSSEITSDTANINWTIGLIHWIFIIWYECYLPTSIGIPIVKIRRIDDDDLLNIMNISKPRRARMMFDMDYVVVMSQHGVPTNI